MESFTDRYVGESSNPERRLKHHHSTSTGFTARYRPWRLIFTQEFPTKEEAVEAEQLIKSWKSRKMTRYVVEVDVWRRGDVWCLQTSIPPPVPP